MAGALHTEIRDKLGEIGRFEGYPASETEYTIDSEVLDAVWRKTLESTPKFVFEVHIEGDLRKAIAKLRRAWILWNSQPRLVTTEDEAITAMWYIDGTYPEMVKDTRIVPYKVVLDLYDTCFKRELLRESLGY